MFKLGIGTVVHWVRRFRETGSVAAKPMGGDYRSRLILTLGEADSGLPRVGITDERDWILQRIEKANALHKISRSAAARTKGRAGRAPAAKKAGRTRALLGALS